MAKQFPRKGAWAVYGNTLGVIATLNVAQGTCEFHQVQENGDTGLIVPAAPLADVRQATWEEMQHLERVQHLTDEQRVGFGYQR